MLWKVEGTNLALFGSVHLYETANPPLSDPVVHAFRKATRVVFEHDFTRLPDLAFARLPAGRSLQAVVPLELFRSVQSLCHLMGLDVAAFSALQPWLVANQLTVEIVKRSGFHHAGIEGRLLHQARDQGKSVEFLEGAGEAFRALGAGPVEEQIVMLRFAVTPNETITFIRSLLEGWKQRRGDLILSCLHERASLMPITQASVIDHRNHLWLPQLVRYLADKASTLVVVGVLHTLGPAGLPALLRAAGHVVRGVDIAQE